MTLDQLRRAMRTLRDQAAADAKAAKDSNLVWDRLRRFYRQANAVEKSMADRVFAEWLLSGDPELESDAGHLISDFDIGSAAPALRELAQRHAGSAEVGAKYWAEAANNLASRLERGEAN